MPYPWNSFDTLTAADLNAAIGLASAPGSGSGNAGRNLVHNSMFNVGQRLPVTWNQSGQYGLDRWYIQFTGDTVNFTQQPLTDADRAAIGDEAALVCMQNTFTTTGAPTSNNIVVHPIEGVRRLGGKTITVSFWAKAASATPKLGINIIQNFGSGGASPTIWAFLSDAAVTLSTNWSRYSVTLTMPSTATKTLGSDRKDYSGLSFIYSNGSVGSATGAQSGTVSIWGVQLEIAASATPFEKIDPAQDLSLCQRFFQIGSMAAYGYGTTGISVVMSNLLPVSLRGGPLTVTNGGATTNANLTSVSINAISYAAVQIVGTVTATGAYGYANTFTISADL